MKMKTAPVNLPFREQIKFFRQKVNVPTTGWRDLMKAEHDRAFVVAGATKADLLADLRNAVDKAIAEGKSLEWFQEQFESIVAKHGWEYHGTPAWRARTILENNINSSYAAARYAQQTDPDFLALNPYWEWRHGDSVHPRPQHLAWDGMVLPADHPWWNAHYPPCGWGCKCKVFALGPDALQQRGIKVLKEPRKNLPGPKAESEVMKGVDVGWNYTPGKTVRDQLRPIIQRKVDKAPPKISADLKAEMRAYLKDLERDTKRLQREERASKRGR